MRWKKNWLVRKNEISNTELKTRLYFAYENFYFQKSFSSLPIYTFFPRNICDFYVDISYFLFFLQERLFSIYSHFIYWSSKIMKPMWREKVRTSLTIYRFQKRFSGCCASETIFWKMRLFLFFRITQLCWCFTINVKRRDVRWFCSSFTWVPWLQGLLLIFDDKCVQ